MFKKNPSILIFFFRVKANAPLSSADVERPSLSLHLFYEFQLWYIANQIGSAKKIDCPNIGENIEMLVCFICMGTQDRTLIDSNYYEPT